MTPADKGPIQLSAAVPLSGWTDLYGAFAPNGRATDGIDLTLRLHASALASPHDGEGQVALDRHDFRQLFLGNTPWHAYVARATAAFSADYRSQLPRVDVPTLIITPSHDELIGADAAQTMLKGISDAAEVVLHRTGHTFRFTHPQTYAASVEEFVAAKVATPMEQMNAAWPTVAHLPVA